MKTLIVINVLASLAAMPVEARVPVPTLNINGGQILYAVIKSSP